MNAEIRRILCATDLSDNCDHILCCAVNLASKKDAELLVIHVINRRSIKVAKTLAYFFNEPQDLIIKKKTCSALQLMKERLEAFYKRELKKHPEYVDLVEHMLVYPGKVAEEIVEKANRFGCEAIVLGSHSTSFLTRFFSGGTTKKVLKQTKKSVFIISVKKGTIDIRSYSKGSSYKGVHKNCHASY